MPLVGLLIGGVDLSQLDIVLKPAVLDERCRGGHRAAVTLGIGTFLTTVIDFVLVALRHLPDGQGHQPAATSWARRTRPPPRRSPRTGSHQRGAADRGIRDPNLGKVVLYQLSYFRM